MEDINYPSIRGSVTLYNAGLISLHRQTYLSSKAGLLTPLLGINR